MERGGREAPTIGLLLSHQGEGRVCRQSVSPPTCPVVEGASIARQACRRCSIDAAMWLISARVAAYSKGRHQGDQNTIVSTVPRGSCIEAVQSHERSRIESNPRCIFYSSAAPRCRLAFIWTNLSQLAAFKARHRLGKPSNSLVKALAGERVARPVRRCRSRVKANRRASLIRERVAKECVRRRKGCAARNSRDVPGLIRDRVELQRLYTLHRRNCSGKVHFVCKEEDRHPRLDICGSGMARNRLLG
eukprot:scaffold68327_cov39-Tisochrysis_lutea.AAC.3